jgi:hypothetical protein
MAGRHRNRAKKDTGATGKPTPGKDRSAHDAARGKKMSLDALSKEVPDEAQLDGFIDLLTPETDRSAAIMASSLLDLSLYVMLTSSLADWGKTETAQWFDGPMSPFRSFSSRITLGFAMGIYGQEMKDRLDIIRNIRNVFAHRVLPLDFDHPVVQAECRKLFNLEFSAKHEKPARIRFCASCVWIARKFIDDGTAHAGKKLVTRFD